ncbi:MAG: cytochrome bc complex cytochrome b subunit [Candidatus Bathyarchaeia archaeon]|jgi:quinol-cytochrome oxidoreductase complex cytochrome b subunit
MTIESDTKTVRLVKWLDTRLGLSYPLLRPVPAYAINPFYWLGALPVVAFLIQGITGVIMILYYVPTPTAAYTSTQYIFNRVYYGRFLETVHLYTAYAMIMLAFMHLMRDYFVSAHKKPREIMWVVGMIMGFVTLGFGFTGYLLPWTVVSKSATDVGVGMIDALPSVISSRLSFLVVGGGGDATELLRFYDLHIIVLPAVLLALLTIKLYMLEVHGISEPTGSKKDTEQIAIFPDVTIYLMELAAMFGAAMLLISVLFPLTLPPPYTPALASQSIAQPDWYFLWVYQILKISVFEGPGLPIALGMVTLIFILLVLLPFIDRGSSRAIVQRPIFVTLGLIFIGEIIVLAAWGLLTPGQIIPLGQALLVLGGVALIIVVISLSAFHFFAGNAKHTGSPKNTMGKFNASGITAAFAIIVSVGALAIGTSLSSIVHIILNGADLTSVATLGAGLSTLALMIVTSLFLLYMSDRTTGRLRMRNAFFERIARSWN